MQKRWMLGLSLILLVLVLAACSDKDETKEEEPAEDSEATNQQDMPEPDLEGIPDVVAEVNGEEILREDFETTYQGQFQEAMMQSQMTGQEVDQDQLKEQIVDVMVGQELLVQGADSGSFDASEEDIDKVLDQHVEQSELESKDEFMAALEEQGMNEEEVLSQLELQVKIDQFISSEIDISEPTDEELEEYYDQILAQQEQMAGEDDDEEADIPSFDELKPDLVEQVKGQKEAEAVQTLIAKLREDADITTHL